MHAVPIDDFPSEWIAQSWVARAPASLGPRPSIDGPVLVHGDALRRIEYHRRLWDLES